MIDIKTPQQIEIMKVGGHMLATTLFKTLEAIKPGMSEAEIDKMAEESILRLGGKPGFKKVKGYHHTICASTNNVVVHGIPGPYVLKVGDIIGIDCGVFYKGFHTDMSETIRVGAQKNEAVDTFLKTGKYALEEAIKVAKPGNRVGHISKTIQDIVEGKGYSIVRSLIGHGVGRELHEEPEVPGFLHGSISRTPELKVGMTIAIEVIYNMGKPEVEYSGKDDWTIVSADGSLSGVFERTVVITENGPLMLTA